MKHLLQMFRSCRAASWSPALLMFLLTLVSFCLQPGLAQAQPDSPLTIEAISLLPESLTPDSLCELRVAIKNSGTQVASALEFEVKVNDVSLPVYTSQLFFDRLEPGAVAEIRLHNFWVSETGRPAPKGNELAVEVSVRSASWMAIEMVEEPGDTADADPVQVEEWTPGEPVPSLPVVLKKMFKLAKAASK